MGIFSFHVFSHFTGFWERAADPVVFIGDDKVKILMDGVCAFVVNDGEVKMVIKTKVKVVFLNGGDGFSWW
jgi:hypothetical protein